MTIFISCEHHRYEKLQTKETSEITMKTGPLLLLTALSALFCNLVHTTSNGVQCSLESCTCSVGEYCSMPSELTGSGSGSSMCMPCNSSCVECYGPYENQCLQCPGLYMHSETLNSSFCINGSVVNDPVTLTCVGVCPPGFAKSSVSMKCIKTLLPFENFWIFVIIGGIGLTLILTTLIFLTCCLICCYRSRQKRNKHKLHNDDSVLQHSTMSSSFKLVPQSNNPGRWRRSDKRDISTKESETNLQDQVYLKSVETFLDPYSPFNNANAGNSQTSQNSDSTNNERGRLDSYVKMQGYQRAANDGRSVTISEFPTTAHPPLSTNTSRAQTLPLSTEPAANPDTDDEQDEYIDPNELREGLNPNSHYYQNQRSASGLQPEDYENPHQLGYGSQEAPDDQQELYVDMEHGREPSVPPRGVICATTQKNTDEDLANGLNSRRSTMDNEYVKMNPQVDKILNDPSWTTDSYVNVPSRKDGRSATAPILHLNSAQNQELEQPSYYNVTHSSSKIGIGEEQLYTNVS